MTPAGALLTEMAVVRVQDGSPGLSAGGTWVGKAVYPRGGQRSPVEEAVPEPKRETGPERWARWAEMVEGGMTRAEVARTEGVSRAAVTMGLRKLDEDQGASGRTRHSGRSDKKPRSSGSLST